MTVIGASGRPLASTEPGRSCRPASAGQLGQSTGGLACDDLADGGAILVRASPTRRRRQPKKKLALVGGMLLDGYEVPPLHHAAILIEDNKIVAGRPGRRRARFRRTRPSSTPAAGR